MKLETLDSVGGLEAEIARLRTQALAWEQVWKALMEHGPHGWMDFSKVGAESAVNAIRALAASAGTQDHKGYVDAFYDLAQMMNVSAQPLSPKVVWETQMRPALQALTTPDAALLRFYQVTDYPALVAALETHVLKLIDTCARNVKPWEDTFPPTLLPKWQREQAAQGMDWRLEASRWLAAKADAQDATNTEYPRHAEAYPNWRDRALTYRALSLEVLSDQRDAAPGVANA